MKLIRGCTKQGMLMIPSKVVGSLKQQLQCILQLPLFLHAKQILVTKLIQEGSECTGTLADIYV